MQQKVPLCPSCHGVVKPDITFFGEKLPPSVKRAVEADHNKVTTWTRDRGLGWGGGGGACIHCHASP